MRMILIQEVRALLLSSALWMMLVILSLLAGYSFIQAVDLFSKASQTASAFPELASGINPSEGIFVPAFGAYYLIETLLLPFLAIRLIGLDKQSGALKLLLQLPLSLLSLNAAKLMAMGIVLLLSMLPAVSVVILWKMLGGAVCFPEIFTLLLGHALYSLTIVCIALFAAAISDTLSTAAMICLSATLGSWVLDFAASGKEGWLGALGNWSMTDMLRQFESGLLSSDSIISFLTLSALFFILASVWLHPGHRLYHKIRTSVLRVIFILIAALGVMYIPQFSAISDVTENRKHSFNPADERALRQMREPLKITIHLSSQDSRLYDFKHGVLSRLRRIVPDLEVAFAEIQSAGLFSAPENDTYGRIIYEYAGKQDQSYSNSPSEILPLLHALAGKQVTPDPMPDYAGHPLVADASDSQWWFYVFLPLLFLSGGYLSRHSQLF
jgi:hypothetical protein